MGVRAGVRVVRVVIEVLRGVRSVRECYGVLGSDRDVKETVKTIGCNMYECNKKSRLSKP